MAAWALASFENTTHESSPLGFGPAACMRAAIHRTYKGDLAGESQAELLVCQPAEGLFGYVGLDVFTGTLVGRRGSFVYQHGEMYDHGAARPFGFVVTGSGTGELLGLRGELSIVVSAEGQHHVTLDYAFE